MNTSCSKNQAALFSLKVSGLHMTEQSNSRLFIEKKKCVEKSMLVEDDTSITQIVTPMFYVKLGEKKRKACDSYPLHLHLYRFLHLTKI